MKKRDVPAWKEAQFNAIFLRAKSSYLRGQHGREISLLSHFSLATRRAFHRQQRTQGQALNYEGFYYLIVLSSHTSPSLGEPEAERHLDVHLLQLMGWQVLGVQEKPKIKLGMCGSTLSS